MERKRKTPEQYHKKVHHRSFQMGILFEACWYCQRQIAHCKSKRTYPDVQSAAAVAQEINIAEGWAKPVRPYRCRQCSLYHLATAKLKGDRKKVERQRRKWLVAQLDQENRGLAQ